MTGYIKSPKDYSTLRVIEISSYDLPLETDLGATGSVTCVGFIGDQYERMLLMIDGIDGWFVLGENTSATLEDNQVSTIQIRPWQCALEACTFESWVENTDPISFGASKPFLPRTNGQISSGLYYIADAYAPDFVSRDNDWMSSVQTYLNGVMIPETCYTDYDSGLVSALMERYCRVYDQAKFMNELQKTRVRADAEWVRSDFYGTNATLKNLPTLNFKNLHFVYDDSVYPLFFNDGHSVLNSFSIEKNIISSVRGIGVYHINTLRDTEKYYFILQTDGTIQSIHLISPSIEAAVDQQRGQPAVVAEAFGAVTNLNVIRDRLTELAEEQLATNEYKHKAEFRSDKRFHMGQRIRLVMDGFTFDTSISEVRKTSDSSMYKYVCGELPVTTTEKIKDSSWVYGRRLPLNPRKGQLVFI